MDRFVAFRWDPGSEAASGRVQTWCNALRARDSGWSDLINAPGLRLLMRLRPGEDAAATPISGGTGVVIGQIFERGSGPQGGVRTIDGKALWLSAADSSSARPSPYWGCFVAIRLDDASGDLHVMRDPCGSLPCFVTKSHGIDLLCASVDDLSGLPELNFSINWTAIRAFLVHSYFTSRHTGLQEITEVLPGEHRVLRADGQSSTSWTWTPAAFAGNPRKRCFEDACRLAREIADDCFAAWAGACRHVAVRMSGGLDSSIVASVMKRAEGARLTGIHLIGRGYEAYELRLARLAARNAGVDLIELEMGSSTLDIADMLSAPKLPRPSAQLLGAAADRRLSTACHELGCDAVMTGHGGDALFLQRSLAADVLADYLRLEGVSPALFRKAYECAVLFQAPVWSVFRRTGGTLFGRKRWSPLAFLEADDAPHRKLGLAGAVSDLEASHTHHDWLAAAACLPPCKAEQVRAVTALRHYHSQMSHALAFRAVQPLVSQPIVEFCLETPAHIFCAGGVDRALERTAFGDLIPPEIARRFEKGFVNHQLTHELSEISDALLEFLSEGHIVAQGLVSPAAIQTLFGDEELLPAENLAPVMSLLAAEAWVAAWRREPGVR